MDGSITKEDLDQLFADDLPKLPFPHFRANLKEIRKPDYPQMDASHKLAVATCDNLTNFFPQASDDVGWLVVESFGPDFAFCVLVTTDYARGSSASTCLLTWDRGQWLNSDNPMLQARMTETGKTFGDQAITEVLTTLLAFLIDVTKPTNHIVLITPNKPSKSVQWLKARTHYTLITHGHPANRKSVGEKQRVANDAQGELSRLAHNRRAHWRIYRHERYRFAKGDRRWVKAAWIGPKEWQDEGGKQIYRILEPVI